MVVVTFVLGLLGGLLGLGFHHSTQQSKTQPQRKHCSAMSVSKLKTSSSNLRFESRQLTNSTWTIPNLDTSASFPPKPLALSEARSSSFLSAAGSNTLYGLQPEEWGGVLDHEGTAPNCALQEVRKKKKEGPDPQNGFRSSSLPEKTHPAPPKRQRQIFGRQAELGLADGVGAVPSMMVLA